MTALVGLAGALLPTGGARAEVECKDHADTAVRFTIPVNGQSADGFYALPDVKPVGLVVFSHGYGHSSYSWQHHLRRVAAELDVIAVAMDYRGITFLPTFKAPGIPDTRGWNVTAGAEDGIAAAQHFEAACRTIDTIVNYGVSMGANTSGLMAAANADRSDGSPLFDYWVDIEGAVNVSETYTGARILAPVNAFARQAEEDIRAEMGGTFEQRTATFLEKSVVTRAPDMKASGLKGVVLVHGVDDGLVTYDQSVQMRAALNAVGIPTQMFTVTSRSPQSERETTLTGYLGSQLDPNYKSPLAGHASEMSTTHIVSVLGFERLTALFNGQAPDCTREHVTDGQLATTVPAPSAC
ncbi:MAG TPA: prolyl oligopeptidase family serine peptidase [Acidimicrobiales bacterium]|nr:prolyl oligopeptidase family serine peptidase [Acidimicrobiales bacterium]